MSVYSNILGVMADFIVGGVSGVRQKVVSNILQFRSQGDISWRGIAVRDIKIHKDNASFGITLTVPDGMGGNITLVLPNGVGSPGQFLQSDGSGGMNWANSVSNGALWAVESFTQATSSPQTIFTPPANSYITKALVSVTTPAGGGSPTLALGISGQTALYMATTENYLLQANDYVKDLSAAAGASPAPIIATHVPNGQTYSGLIFVEYTNPA